MKVVREIYLFKWNEETGCLRKLHNDVHNLSRWVGHATCVVERVQPLDVAEGA